MADEAESVFARSHAAVNPYTLGLSVGADAPRIQGTDWANSQGLPAVVNGTCDPDYYPVDTASGVPVSAPGAMTQLAAILSQILEAK